MKRWLLTVLLAVGLSTPTQALTIKDQIVEGALPTVEPAVLICPTNEGPCAVCLFTPGRIEGLCYVWPMSFGTTGEWNSIGAFQVKKKDEVMM